MITIKLTSKERELLLQACIDMKIHLEEIAADEPLPYASTNYGIEADQYKNLIKKLNHESN